MRHAIPWLWHFHTIHHSQREMNPKTTHRMHPVEPIFTALVMLLPQSLLCTHPLPWAHAILVNRLWDQAIHSDLRSNWGWVGKWFVSPQHHRIHHALSKAHMDKYFG